MDRSVIEGYVRNAQNYLDKIRSLLVSINGDFPSDPQDALRQVQQLLQPTFVWGAARNDQLNRQKTEIAALSNPQVQKQQLADALQNERDNRIATTKEFLKRQICQATAMDKTTLSNYLAEIAASYESRERALKEHIQIMKEVLAQFPVDNSNPYHHTQPRKNKPLAFITLFFIVAVGAIWVLSLENIIASSWAPVLGAILVILGVLFAFLQWMFPRIPTEK